MPFSTTALDFAAPSAKNPVLLGFRLFFESRIAHRKSAEGAGRRLFSGIFAFLLQ
jgi:hypothetical protein